MATASDLASHLTAARYLSLTTYRRSGEAVATPVWFVPQPDGTVLVYTEASSGKVKRLRHTPDCTVAACDARGRVRGEVADATATVLDDQAEVVYRRLVRRYGWQAQAFGLLARLRRRGEHADAVGIRLSARPD